MSLSLLCEIAGEGVRIRADGGNLTVSRANLTDALTARIRDNKPALIASLARLREFAMDDDEWTQITSDSAKFRGFLNAVITMDTCKRGEIPEHYTSTTTCRRCGEVPVWPTCPPRVAGCPWCSTGTSVADLRMRDSVLQALKPWKMS